MYRSSRSPFGRAFDRPLIVVVVLCIVTIAAPATAADRAAPVTSSPAEPMATAAPFIQAGTLGPLIIVQARRLAASAETQVSGDTMIVHERSWAGRHPILLGALIGLGVGLGNEATQCVAGVQFVPHSGEGLPCDARVAAVVGGLSAAIGAGVGAVAAIFLR